jgi:hypothetical protein
MPVQRFYSSVAQPTTLAGGISAGSATITVLATTGFPAFFPYTLSLDPGAASEELVEVTSAAGVVLTITRGIDGTSAQSHGSGAVVRHSMSARDLADFQTHQAATSDVHGVTGALVGASSTQTLANKTLTSPTINAGALSGTFTGSPTFSGTPTFAGGVLNGTYTGSPTLSGNPSFTGAPSFTGGALFQRGAANTLAYHASVTADTQDRHQVQADGKHLWGSGAATLDTTLYRGAAGQLKTDGDLVATGNISGGNFPSGAWSTWTPAWTTTTGAHLPSYGNAVVSASYVKLGRLLFTSVGITFGSSTNFGTGATGSDNWIFSLPGTLAASAAFSGSQLICGMGRATADTSNTMPFTVRVDSGGTNFLLDLAGGKVSGTAPAFAGAMDSLTPWTWAANNQIQFTALLETAS